MTLSAVEQTKFRQYVDHHLMRKVQSLILQYIIRYENDHLKDDLEDKGYDEVKEAFVKYASHLEFHWTKS